MFKVCFTSNRPFSLIVSSCDVTKGVRAAGIQENLDLDNLYISRFSRSLFDVELNLSFTQQTGNKCFKKFASRTSKRLPSGPVSPGLVQFPQQWLSCVSLTQDGQICSTAAFNPLSSGAASADTLIICYLSVKAEKLLKWRLPPFDRPNLERRWSQQSRVYSAAPTRQAGYRTSFVLLVA